ncbi:MAG: glycosyltransferase family 4 protein [bacterium]|nr:glycosyltransferase family 4 protein [bacterium]
MKDVIFSVGVPVPGAGMGNHAYQLLKGLDRHKMLQKAFVMQLCGNKELAVSVQSLYFSERLAYRVARYTGINKYLLRDNLFDFLVSQQLRNAGIFYGWTHHALWSLKRARHKGMLTILERANSHPITFSRLLEDEYKKRGMPFAPYHPLIFKKHLREIQIADYIAVTSQFTKQSLLEHGVDEQRILVTPLGVDCEHFHPPETKKDDAIFRVVYVGQIRLRKGVHYLLEAWEALQLEQAELLLLGDVVDEMKTLLDSYCRRHSAIKVLAHVENPLEIYQQASVCILPTLEDGFGLVVLEAMACGLPVIVTEHTGAKDCVRPGLDGFIIPPYDAESIAETLRHCYRNQADLPAMGTNARRQAETFSWDRYQDGLASQIAQLG